MKTNDKLAKHVVIVVHGSLRDGDSYWSLMNDIFADLIKQGDARVDRNLIIVAPEFFSAEQNEGQYSSKQLAWPDLNLWQPGEASSRPKGLNISSYEAIEKLVDHFDNSSQYPQMKNITLVGHSGGGQLVNRYATLARKLPQNTHMRFIVADPSSSLYFTEDRAVTDKNIVDKAKCPLYNSYRYGFDNLTIPIYGGQSAQTGFKNYVTRDIVHLNGLLDTEVNGDQQCMAILQGGTQRISRNFSWWKYLNLIAGTGEDMRFFPGNFTNVPNWKHLYSGDFTPRLSIVANASHDVDQVFNSAIGNSALFDTDVLPGWRPEKPGQSTDSFPSAAIRAQVRFALFIPLVALTSIFLR
ncbi:hypothetical protein MVES1_001362 [Malassezia vespertilionis]|uniref:Uncharacterized protein n=1 Tax=Malassezia vespertilionis TaxID=2020962 RepID=A0A2N1JE62_9BASI|nr:uncharacterized protein MVES1_001362 [Malassezia vespertilionis]PKI84850.1 hypothetical protein MVES_001278 [Malassezia vespertilionis]WFD06024.1 hypothetical protein MVES1_001362 [Malassezia vespertilionis]